MGQNSDGAISDFRISGQFLIKGNFHNSRTSNDIDMKPGPVTKIDKRNKTTSKKIWRWSHVRKLWRHCYFSNLEPSGSRIPDGQPVKLIFLLIVTFLSNKNWKGNWKISNTTLTLLLWIKVLFWPKNAYFLQKDAYITKIKRFLVLKSIFSETTYVYVLVCVCMCQIWSF